MYRAQFSTFFFTWNMMVLRAYDYVRQSNTDVLNVGHE